MCQPEESLSRVLQLQTRISQLVVTKRERQELVSRQSVFTELWVKCADFSSIWSTHTVFSFVHLSAPEVTTYTALLTKILNRTDITLVSIWN